MDRGSSTSYGLMLVRDFMEVTPFEAAISKDFRHVDLSHEQSLLCEDIDFVSSTIFSLGKKIILEDFKANMLSKNTKKRSNKKIKLGWILRTRCAFVDYFWFFCALVFGLVRLYCCVVVARVQ